MKIKSIIFIVSILMFNNIIFAQENEPNHHYQRIYIKLINAGLSNNEIEKYFKEKDSLERLNFIKFQKQSELAYRTSNPINSSQSLTCNDVPADELNVLQAIFTQLNGAAWTNAWDFNNTPVVDWVSNWYNSNDQVKWEIIVENCHITEIHIKDVYNTNLNSANYTTPKLIGTIPDLSDLVELKAFSLETYNSNSNPYIAVSSHLFGSSANFGALQKLEYLSLYRVRLDTSLPINFINLHNTIEHLSLFACGLQDYAQLDSVISSFTNLISLNLSHNFFYTIQNSFQLPPSFSNLNNLETISITNSSLNNISVLSQLPQLERMYFYNNYITNFPNLANNNYLTSQNFELSLDLESNELNGSMPSFFNNSNFNTLDVTNNFLSGLVPTIHVPQNSPSQGVRFAFGSNYFRFNDFIQDFNLYEYSGTGAILYEYAPQRKTDDIQIINANIGDTVEMRMFTDNVNFHTNDTFQWYKGIYPDISQPINPTESPNNRILSFTANTNTGGDYFCLSRHNSPEAITNTLVEPKLRANLTLVRNQVTVNTPCFYCSSFDLVKGDKYLVSGWVKEGNNNGISTNNISYTESNITISFLDINTTIINTLKFYPSGEIIDGWQRIIGEFSVPSDVDEMNIDLVNENNTGLNSFFDDIRLIPSKANMKSFVYDQDTQRLMAELDENNFATFYEYDLEGGLIRIKKETEEGVYTIQETRSSNIKRD